MCIFSLQDDTEDGIITSYLPIFYDKGVVMRDTRPKVAMYNANKDTPYYQIGWVVLDMTKVPHDDAKQAILSVITHVADRDNDWVFYGNTPMPSLDACGVYDHVLSAWDTNKKIWTDLTDKTY